VPHFISRAIRLRKFLKAEHLINLPIEELQNIFCLCRERSDFKSMDEYVDHLLNYNEKEISELMNIRESGLSEACKTFVEFQYIFGIAEE
jgi:hypothetical protein